MLDYDAGAVADMLYAAVRAGRVDSDLLPPIGASTTVTAGVHDGAGDRTGHVVAPPPIGRPAA